MSVKALIIEDDPDLLRLMSNAFVGAGFETFSAKDGYEAAKVFNSRQLDLVVTDILMPEKEGFETILAIKRGRAPPKVIAISGGGRFGAENFLLWAKALGADEVLKKPFHMSTLVAVGLSVLASLPTEPLTIPRAATALAL